MRWFYYRDRWWYDSNCRRILLYRFLLVGGSGLELYLWARWQILISVVVVVILVVVVMLVLVVLVVVIVVIVILVVVVV